jgi:tight adherence protein B
MVTALAGGLALLCWPSDAGRLAVEGARPAGGRVGRWRTWRRVVPPAVVAGRWVIGLIGLAGSVIWAAGGPAVAASAVLWLGTSAGLTRGELRRRRVQADLVGLLAAVRTLAREVRSGAQPLAAVSAVAAAHRGSSGLVLEHLATVVGTDRGGGTPPPTDGSDPASEISGRLAAGWALSARYGVPWVGLLDALATDLADRVRAASSRAAQVSGPRVSGYVLASMPVLGLVLGVGMGADPVGILLGTGAGHLMLLAGSTLTCAGLCWTATIVHG